MDKRFPAFIAASLAVVLLYIALHAMFGPKPPPRDENQAAQQGDQPAKDDNAADPNGKAPAKNGDENRQANGGPPSSGSRENDPPTEPDDENGDPPADPAAAPDRPDQPAIAAPSAQKFYTIGSVDPDSGYRMLATFNSRGAAVERVELSSPRYRELSDRTGYMGELNLRDDPLGRGCEIRVVGAGTPAALAQSSDPNVPNGLLPGDILTSVAGQSTASGRELQLVWRNGRLRAGQTVEVKVLRRAQAPANDGNEDAGNVNNRAAAAKRELTFSVALIRPPMQVIRPPWTQLTEETERGGPRVWDDSDENLQLSYLLTLHGIGPRKAPFGQDELAHIPSLFKGNWEGETTPLADGEQMTFRRRIAPEALAKLDIEGDLEVIKRFTLRKAIAESSDPRAEQAYHMEFEIEIRNLGAKETTVAYRLQGPTGLPLEGWWYTFKTHPTKFGTAGARDVVWRSPGGAHFMFTNPVIVGRAQSDPQSPFTKIAGGDGDDPVLQYAGVDAHYFVSALVADPAVAEQAGQGKNPYAFAQAEAFPPNGIDKTNPRRTDVTVRLLSTEKTIPAGGSYSMKVQIFAGPKEPEILAAYGLEETVVYGWFWFVARPMIGLLHFFYAIVGNYGLAIIMLTVLVRSLMFPLGRKMAMNAQKMQELAPELKAIADKYKNDMQKRAEAQRELFIKHKYNPLAGCPLMLLQLPIFIGLYRGLSVDIALRDAPLIPGIRWASNLAGPDQFWFWQPWFENVPLLGGLVQESGFLGPYLNILPLVTMALFILTMRLFTPPPTDEQQAMQQKIMQFMMIFMGFLFFKVPAGLCLYFIASSLWGIGERLLLPKSQPAGANGSGSAADKVALARANEEAAIDRKERQRERRKQKKQ